jgi:hypothetical protein
MAIGGIKQSLSVRSCMIRMIAVCAAVLMAVPGRLAESQTFTIEQALSAPFASDLSRARIWTVLPG